MKQPNLVTTRSDEIVTFLKFKIRDFFGDKIENNSDVYAVRGGWYYINIPDLGWRTIGFRRTSVPKILNQLRKLRRDKGK